MPVNRGETLATEGILRRWTFAAVVFPIVLNGCVTNWQAQEAAPRQVIESTGETEVRVTLKNGTSSIVRDPAVAGDSLVGWQQPPDHRSGAPVVRQAFALSDVRTVSVKKSNTGANIAIGAAIGAAIFAASVFGAVLAICGGSGCD